MTLYVCTLLHQHTQSPNSKDSCNDHVDCEDSFSGPDSPAHHGNTSYCAGPAAALAFCALHANQASSIPNTFMAPEEFIPLYRRG